MASNLEGVSGVGELAVDCALSLTHGAGENLTLEIVVFFLDGPIQKAKDRTTFGEFDLVILEFGILYFSVLHSYIKRFT